MRRLTQRRASSLAAVGGALGAAAIVLSAVRAASRGRGGSSGGGRVPGEKRADYRTLTVIGHGSVSAPLDEALVALEIRVMAASTREAITQGNVAMLRIVGVVKEHGIAERQIHTSRFTIVPEYSHDEGHLQPLRYRVTNAIHVIAEDLPKVGELLDAVVAAAADTVVVRGVELLARDTSDAQGQARTAAMAHAREKARQIAREAGVTLGDLLSISEALEHTPGGMHHARLPVAYFDATSIQVAELEVSAALEVVWALE